MQQRSSGLAVVVLSVLATTVACKHVENPDLPDGRPGIDAPGTDAPVVDGESGIAAARAAADGDVSLAIHGATVTYLKPAVAGATNDPAGFTIQAAQTGPALFVAVDPATLSPVPAVGDVVDFTITKKVTYSQQVRATAITGLTRSATGRDVHALAQDLTAASDVVSALDNYDSELIDLTANVTADFSTGGTGFLRATVATPALTDANYQIRLPVDVVDAIDLVKTCRVVATDVPMGRFGGQAQLAIYSAGDMTLSNCPAPQISGATAISNGSIRLTFTRHIAPGSVRANGSQFTSSNGLTVTAATVNGRVVTLTTSAQAAAATYDIAIASTVTDLQGSPVASPNASVVGFGPGSGAMLSVHTKLGIPSPANATDTNNFLSVKSGYVVSYNGSRKVPNWVSWEVNTSYFGSIDRQNDYRPDDTFPSSQPQASLADYSGSGFERGHMCPSADRTLTTTANSQTFYLTNMVPQSANNNEGPWADLENETRAIARTNKEIFVIAGGTFSAGSGTVGNGMRVPDKTFKVIVILNPGQGPADVTTSTRVIAVLMPNNNTDIQKDDNWKDYRVSVDQIEALTGYDFLSDVSTSVQAVIEARVDNL